MILVRCRRRLFVVKEQVFDVGTLPQALFFVEKRVIRFGTLPQAPFFWWKNAFLVLERCRRQLFGVENCVFFGPGTLPQAPLLLKMKVNVSPFRKAIFLIVSHRNL